MTYFFTTVLETTIHFNSHAHVERDTYINEPYKIMVNFNSHAHVERDHGEALKHIIVPNFNSHAHVERDIASLASF